MPRGKKKTLPTSILSAFTVVSTKDGLYKVVQLAIDLESKKILDVKYGVGDSKNFAVERALDYLTISILDGTDKIIDFH
jgi:hypothetical protein